MVGIKESTLQTPANTPSIIKECIAGLMPNLLRAASAAAVRLSRALLKSPLKKAPITSKVR